MNARTTASVIVIAALAAVACKPTGPGADTTTANPPMMCTMQAVAALNVDAIDSAKGTPATMGSSIVARSDTFADSTQGAAPSNEPVGLAYEKAGTYTVTVTKPGYKPWSQQGIVVGRDQCHVIPQRITAKLRRS